jgi:hypothetical protein
VRFELIRTDGSRHGVEVGLARASAEPALIRHLLSLRLDGIDAGFGFEVLRLAAVESEPASPYQHRGQLAAGAEAARRRAEPRRRGGTGTAENPAVADLISCLGARVGIEKIVRFQPVDTHIPEKSRRIVPAAFSKPVAGWPQASAPRPNRMFPPEPLQPVAGARDDPRPPRAFRWRRRTLTRAAAFGPERIAPEWWLDDPAWPRSGPDVPATIPAFRWRSSSPAPRRADRRLCAPARAFAEGRRWADAAPGAARPAATGSSRASSPERLHPPARPPPAASGGVRPPQDADARTHAPPLLGGRRVALLLAGLRLLGGFVFRAVAMGRVQPAGIIIDLGRIHRWSPLLLLRTRA